MSDEALEVARQFMIYTIEKDCEWLPRYAKKGLHRFIDLASLKIRRASKLLIEIEEEQRRRGKHE